MLPRRFSKTKVVYSVPNKMNWKARRRRRNLISCRLEGEKKETWAGAERKMLETCENEPGSEIISTEVERAHLVGATQGMERKIRHCKPFVLQSQTEST